MVRLFGPLVGLFFAVALLWSFGNGAYVAITEPAAPTAESVFHKHPKELDLASNGAFGRFDKQQLQRGFQVYKEVCATCHSLKQIAFRDLAALGYSEAEVKAIAKGWPTKAATFNPVTGDRGERDNIPSDRIPAVYFMKLRRSSRWRTCIYPRSAVGDIVQRCLTRSNPNSTSSTKPSPSL